MYLQLTTKCNMSCQHCCYSCSMRGKHGDYDTLHEALIFIAGYDDEAIALGGGEPTLHPRFFDLLAHSLERFNYVWFATNGSQTEAMERLAHIIEGNDYESFDDYCTCETDEERDCCSCLDQAPIIYQEGKLTVALSQDSYHDPIDERIIRLWSSRAVQHRRSHYEIRNVTNSYRGLIGQGRAKKLGYSSEGCVCADLLVKPDGQIRLCGCTRSPVIGDIWSGITYEYQELTANSEGYQDHRCCKHL